MMIPGLTIPEPPHKHEHALWYYPMDDYLIYAECSACGESFYGKPSYFCPNCGALMLNVYDTKAHYDDILGRMKEKQEDAKENKGDD